MSLRTLMLKPFLLKPRLLTPLITAALETVLNGVLFNDKSLKAARSRLVGKVLRIELREINFPLLFVFSERQVDVLSQWDDAADCLVKTDVAVLARLRDRQQLSPLMRTGELVVEGDIQVVQQLVALLDLAEWDLAEWLAPYVVMLLLKVWGKLFTKVAVFLVGNYGNSSIIWLKLSPRSGEWLPTCWKSCGFMKKSMQPLVQPKL